MIVCVCVSQFVSERSAILGFGDGGITVGKIGEGEIGEGGWEATFHCLSLT